MADKLGNEMDQLKRLSCYVIYDVNFLLIRIKTKGKLKVIMKNLKYSVLYLRVLHR